MTLRRAYRVPFVFQLLTAPWLAAQNASPVRAAGDLRLHQSIERDLGPGQTDEYRVHAPAGQFFRVVARQMGVDVVVTVIDPSGKTVVEADRMNGAYGPEAASWIGEISGEYRVRVSSGSTKAGRYRMEFPESRQQTGADPSRIEAETAGFQAARERQAGTPEANLRSIELLERARSTWRRLGDSYEEALCWYAAGSIYSNLGEKQKALDYLAQAIALYRAAGDQAGQAAALFTAGSVYSDLDQKPKALDYYGQALPLYRAAGDHASEATLLSTIGNLCFALGEKQKALDDYGLALPLYRSAADRGGEAVTLYDLGAVYSDLNQKAAAVDFFGQALTLYRTLGDRAGQTITLNYLAAIYSGLGKKAEALDSYSQALPLIRTAGDRASEATTLYQLGAIHSELGQKPEALDHFGQALAIHRALGNQAGQAMTLNYLGTVSTALGHKPEALDYYSQALPLYRALGDGDGEATTLYDIGAAYSDLGRKSEALNSLGQALAIHLARGNQAGQAMTLNYLGTVSGALSHRPEALDFYSQALPLYRALGDRAGEATTLYNIGSAYSDLGRKPEALDYFAQALLIHRAVGSQAGQAMTLNYMGTAYSALGERLKSLDVIGQALTLYRSLGDPAGETTALTNLGHVYSDLGEKQKALDYLRQALPLDRAAGDLAGEAAALSNIGAVYSDLGEKPKALEYYQQALSLYRTAGDRSGEAVILNDIGVVYSDLGQKQKALDYYSQSLPIRRAVADRSGEATSLNNLGQVYSELGDGPKALDYYLQALPQMRAVGNRSGEAGVLSNIGRIYADLGEKPKALDYYGQSLPLMHAVGDRSGEATVLGNISSSFEKSQPEMAILFAKLAVNILQSLRRDNRRLDAGLLKSFEKSIESNYRNLAGLLVGRQRFGEAEEVLNLLKDKEAADFIRRDAVSDQLKPAALLDSERAALDRYEQIQNQIVSDGAAQSALVAKAAKTPLSAGESEQSRQLDRDLSAANTVLRLYFDQEEKAFAANSAAAKSVHDELRDTPGVQRALRTLGPGVVAIYTLVLPDKYTALLVTSGARKAYSTAIPEAELNRKIFDFRQQLQNPASNPLPLAQELYKIVFPEELRHDLDAIGARTIMWSLDSTLRYVPIAALHDGRQYLVALFSNSLITPASLTRLTDASPAVWKGVGFGVSQANGNFSALPGVPEELHRIFRQSGDGNAPVEGRVEMDREFTRETFLAAMRQPDKSVVHIATHFDSQPGVAANSHLLLGDGTQMSLAEIEDTDLLFSDVDLLTLSACSTAFTNRAEDGREVDSFGTIAQSLGASAVIASLWSVSDEATARLMQTMYQFRQAQPELGKGEALRHAQAEMAAGVLKPQVTQAADRGVHITAGAAVAVVATAWTHPYYWAPFILIGNWK